ncbi:MAG TPA: hypothetical protein PKH77_06460 [Anaerolineae bacterium]|nr:hypothetical protein [Anaerolineae bacterium]
MTISHKFTYNNRSFTLHIPAPPERLAPRDLSAPGAGAIAIEQLRLSPAALSPDQDVTLTAVVRGAAIAHIFVEVLLDDAEQGYAYGPVYRAYLRAANQEELGGVLRPIWPETVAVAVMLRPTLRVLSDGVASAFAFATPEAYAAPEATTYRLSGRFSSAGSDISRSAHLCFDHAGQMTGMIGMGSLGSAGARALNPQPGDTFTPEGQVLLPPQQPGDAWGEGVCQMTPLTFPETPFRWETCPLPPHTYLAGLVVADLDGGLTRQYAPFTLLSADGASVVVESAAGETPSFFSSLQRGWQRFWSRLFRREGR